MSFGTLILGESGTGKSCSMRNLDPSKILLIQPFSKPLPFRSDAWKGHVFTQSNPQKIVEWMRTSKADVIVIDDFQYLLMQMYMARRTEQSFLKFAEIGGAGYDILAESSKLAQNKRVYVMGHTQVGDDGKTRIKTIGKMLDNVITPEGLFTTVLKTAVENGNYYFSTQNNGLDTVKSPMGMFDEPLIDNDLELVDRRICEYYGIDAADKKEHLKQESPDQAK